MQITPDLNKASIRLRDMQSKDLVPVLSIERNVHVSPWSRLSFEESLTKHEVQEYCCRVIESAREVAGYTVVCPVVDELHILNIVVATQYQGFGLGHMLMQDIIEHAQAQSLRKIFLEVRASNEIAQSLYSKWQFEQISIRKRYYSMPSSTNSNDREDAMVFLRQLPK